MIKYKTVKEIFFLIFCSLLFNYPAFLNGYPLVTSDSGVYMGSGIGPDIPFDRPVLYGLFIRQISMKETQWFVIIAQGLIVAWLLSQVIKHFLPKFYNRRHRFFIFLALTMLTTLPWFCSQIMADVFSPLGIICMGLLLFAPRQNRAEKAFTIILLLFTTLTHNSHLLVNTILVLLAGIYYLFNKYFSTGIIDRKRFLVVFSFVISCWFFAGFINFLIDGKYRLTGSSHVFLTARLAESGMLEDFLKKECGCNKTQVLNDKTNYIIVSKSSRRVLDIDGVKMDDGAHLQQWFFVNGPNQKFHLIHVKDDLYKILAVHSGKAISVLQDSPNPLVQISDTNGIGQLFRLNETKEHFYTINSPQTNEVFEIKDNAEGDGAIVQLGRNLKTDNQMFWIMPDTIWKLCFYQGQIPRKAIDFIWAENSLFWRTGGWDNSKKEYSAIINGILFNPRYILWNIREAFVSTLRQLVHFNVGDGLFRFGENSAPGSAIFSHFRKDINMFMTSIQNLFGFNFDDVNKRIFNTMIVSLIILLIFFSKKSNREDRRTIWLFCVICFSAVIINAFVAGTLANVLDRLQSRIVWLIPFCAILIIYESILHFVDVVNEKLK